MRLKYGPQDTIAQRSIDSKMLIELGVKEPEFMTSILSLNTEEAPFLALLDAKGFTKDITSTANFAFDGGNYRAVSSNHVQYRIVLDDRRKEHFRTNVSGVTFVDSGNPTKPGLGKLYFYIYLDSNWIGGNDVILLADGQTQLFVDNPEGGVQQPGGVWRYRVKIDGNDTTEYVRPEIMADGMECQWVGTKHRQDFSDYANERYSANAIGDAYLTVQRFKYSYSGTAAAMDKKVSGNWVIGVNGQKSFLSYAEQEMLKWAGRALNFQLLEGKGSVSQDTKKVVLTDSDNQEILSGSGCLYSGDGAIDYPQSDGWTPKFLDNFMMDISEFINPDEMGRREAFMLMPSKSFMEFNRMMSEMGVTADSNIEGMGDEKYINNAYSGYKLGNVKLIATEIRSRSTRPGMPLNDGTRASDYECIVIPLGRTNSGQRGIEGISLRNGVRGTVAGIDKGGNVSSSVDGTSEHLLIQNGIICQNQVFRIYKPYLGKLI